jgi:hypothetical protein
MPFSPPPPLNCQFIVVVELAPVIKDKTVLPCLPVFEQIFAVLPLSLLRNLVPFHHGDVVLPGAPLEFVMPHPR